MENNEKKYKHAEAFALMHYKCKACGHTEKIWNSRDGVTPFGLSCPRCGSTEFLHWAWHLDQTIEDYQPKIGQRIFVDLTFEKYQQYTKEYIDKNWDKGAYAMKNAFESKEKAFEVLGSDFEEGKPDVIEHQLEKPLKISENNRFKKVHGRWQYIGD